MACAASAWRRGVGGQLVTRERFPLGVSGVSRSLASSSFWCLGSQADLADFCRARAGGAPQQLRARRLYGPGARGRGVRFPDSDSRGPHLARGSSAFWGTKSRGFGQRSSWFRFVLSVVSLCLCFLTCLKLLDKPRRTAVKHTNM